MHAVRGLVPLQARLTIDLDALAVEDGRPFRGHVSLLPYQDFDVAGVDLEAEVVETWGQEVFERDARGDIRESLRSRDETAYVRRAALSPPFKAVKGRVREFRFEVLVPATPPTREGGVVSYSLRASAHVRGSPDITNEVSTVVTPAGIAEADVFPSLTLTRAVRREVIEVGCDACGALVRLDHGAFKCPHCGAALGHL